MFDLFRSREKSVRILLGVLLGVIALSMLLYLVPGGGIGSGVSNNVVALVGDQKITTTDVQRVIQNVTRGQQNLPKGILAMYLPSMVNQLIESKAMAYKAKELGLQVSDQELADTIQSEVGQAMGGKFDLTVYQSVLAQQGMSVADFENSRREAMMAQRLENLESQALIVSDQDARTEYARKNLRVGLDYLLFDAKAFTGKVNKDSAAIKAYFDKNRAEFRTPEKRDLGLVVGSAADFIQGTKTSDASLQKEYQDNIDSYRTPERIQVRHILIKTQGKPKDELPKLKAKADDLLKQIQHGADFADLAKKNSDDPGSAAKGGELGFIVKGQTVPNFEKTAFALSPGQTSGVIETEYGYHIIQLESKQAAHTQSFDDVKPQIAAESQKQAASENLKKAVDAARAEVVRSPAQAEPIAKKYNLKYFRLSDFAATQSLPEVNNLPELSNSLFATAKGGITEVVEAANQGRDAFGVVYKVTAARNAEYNEVEAQVVPKYTEAESLRLSQAAAAAAVARAKKGEGLETIGKEYGLAVKTAPPFTMEGAAEGLGSASAFAAAFKSKVGDVLGPIPAQPGTAVCKVSQEIPADMTLFAKQKDALVASITQQRQQVQQPLFRESIVSELKRRGKIKVNEAAVQRMVTNFQS